MLLAGQKLYEDDKLSTGAFTRLKTQLPLDSGMNMMTHKWRPGTRKRDARQVSRNYIDLSRLVGPRTAY